jgi:hypothetical protein
VSGGGVDTAALDAARGSRIVKPTDQLVATEIFQALPALLAIARAAEAFVATTSYFRQPKDAQPEFEALVVALNGVTDEAQP